MNYYKSKNLQPKLNIIIFCVQCTILLSKSTPAYPNNNFNHRKKFFLYMLYLLRKIIYYKYTRLHIKCVSFTSYNKTHNHLT